MTKNKKFDPADPFPPYPPLEQEEEKPSAYDIDLHAAWLDFRGPYATEQCDAEEAFCAGAEAVQSFVEE
jgi:hypothetical protein